jgi:hypothetical protein
MPRGREVGFPTVVHLLSAGEADDFVVQIWEPETAFSYPLEAGLKWLHWERDEEYEHVSRSPVPAP